VDEQVHFVYSLAPLDELGQSLHIAGTSVHLLAFLIRERIAQSGSNKLLRHHLCELSHVVVDNYIK
jgi:hypothetical protein